MYNSVIMVKTKKKIQVKFKFTCIAANRDIPEFARDAEGVVGGRFILKDKLFFDVFCLIDTSKTLK